MRLPQSRQAIDWTDPTLYLFAPSVILILIGGPIYAFGAFGRGETLPGVIGLIVGVAVIGPVIWYLRLPVRGRP